ncbi:hypothetical protein L6164_035755 [Bauhinia variegata]|uniref:Uncharacterized protein n=1 Tax=Bauhinia variegata TaxID=167791 RepID=A0ACB9KEX8_BAUVA|nr:hypothetical protein L6164_035755 [Bauhinia variegata]
MGHTLLPGMSTSQRSESMNSFFDKYIHKKITLKELVKQYGTILQNRYEEEAIADFDTLHKQPALKSPSPWEKQMSTIYTHAIFKKFQVEVLGVVGCHPSRETGDVTIAKFVVQDCEKDEEFLVTWNEMKSEVSCFCGMFEYKEGSFSDESYNTVFRALVDALKNCVHVNNSKNYNAEASKNTYSLREAEENQGILAVQLEPDVMLVDAQDSLQQMDNLSSDAINPSGYYGSQQNVRGLQVQLKLMEPPNEGYYVNQQSMQNLVNHPKSPIKETRCN